MLLTGNQITSMMKCRHECMNGLVRFPIISGKIWVCAECGALRIEGQIPYFNSIKTLSGYASVKRVGVEMREIIEHQIELWKNDYLRCQSNTTNKVVGNDMKYLCLWKKNKNRKKFTDCLCEKCSGYKKKCKDYIPIILRGQNGKSG